MADKLNSALDDLLNAYDDGVRSCVGVMSNGDLTWKGSFIAYMERLRELRAGGVQHGQVACEQCGGTGVSV
jgi:hypothetical protein